MYNVFKKRNYCALGSRLDLKKSNQAEVMGCSKNMKRKNNICLDKKRIGHVCVNDATTVL